MHSSAELGASSAASMPWSRWSRGAIGAAIWAGVIVVCGIWGRLLLDSGDQIFLGAPPLLGSWDLRIGPGMVVAVAVAAAIVVAGPALVHRLSWRGLLLCSLAAGALWPVALALSTGGGGVAGPLTDGQEYLTAVPLIHSPGDFLSHFLDRIGIYSTHVRSHPPGMALALFGLERIGLGGAGPAAALTIAVAASTPAAVLLAARSVAGEQPARRAAPFLVLAPAAVWIATSADALYMGLSAWAVSLMVISIAARGRRGVFLALAGGLLFGLTAFLSFGLPLLAAIPVCVAVAARRWQPLLLGALAAGAVALVVAGLGYWWLDGYAAARQQYLESVSMHRPYGFFAFNNVAAFGLALGPAVAVGLARLTDRRLWLLVGGAAIAVLAANLSGMSKAEVERIWLPFLPWILLATAALPQRPGAQRRLLCAQAICAFAIQLAVATPW